MDERLEKAQESAKAARAKSTTATKKGIEQLKVHEKSARDSVKKSLEGLKKH